MSNVVALGEVAEIGAGQGAPQGADKFGEDGHSFVRAGSLEPLTRGMRENGLEHIRDDVAVAHGMKLVAPGTILFAKSGMSATKGLVYQLREPAYVVSHLATVTPKASLDSSYLRYWFTIHSPSLLINDAAYPSIRLPDIAALRIPLPSLAEQRRIAAVLNQADAIRRKRGESLRLLDEFLHSAFLEMFGNPVRNEEGWGVVRLDVVADIVSGVTKGRRIRGETVQAVPYLRVANVQDGFLDLGELKTIAATTEEVAQYRLRLGDIVLTEGGDPDKLGRGAVWRGEVDGCIHQNHIFRVRVTNSDFLPDYVSALLGSTYGKRYFLKAAKQTTGIASINRTQLSAFPVLRAPVDIQQRYAAILASVRQLHGRLDLINKTADSLFDSLAQRAFRGEL